MASMRLNDSNRAVASFTLVELLVVVSILALLIAILIPSLRRARAQAKLTVCLANVRDQGTAVQLYVTEFSGKFPPKRYDRISAGGSETLLINSFLAQYAGRPFPRDESVLVGDLQPQGVWQCPDVRKVDEATERWTHSGIIHHAPNKWVFNNVNIVEQAGIVNITSEAYFGWESSFATSAWRVLEQIPRPSQIVSLIDNTAFYVPGHGHREAHESIGRSNAIIETTKTGNDFIEQHGSHRQLDRRPAVLLDGHAEPLTATESYWQSDLTRYRSHVPNAVTVELYPSELTHFMWFVHPDELIGPASGGGESED